MAISCSVEDVRLIFETPMLDSQLDAFLQPAKRLVDDQLSAAGLTDSRLTDITKFLTAHLASVITPSTLRERVGRDYEFWRTGEFGEGLAATVYGQQVLILDTTGILASAGKKQRITFRVVSRTDE